MVHTVFLSLSWHDYVQCLAFIQKKTAAFGSPSNILNSAEFRVQQRHCANLKHQTTCTARTCWSFKKGRECSSSVYSTERSKTGSMRTLASLGSQTKVQIFKLHRAHANSKQIIDAMLHVCNKNIAGKIYIVSYVRFS